MINDMNKTYRDEIEEEILEENAEDEIEEVTNDDWTINMEEVEDILEWDTWDEALKKQLAQTMADFDNYKKRVERDKDDMVFFLKGDILKTILPRIDDLERILANTPKDMQDNPIYEWVDSAVKKLLNDLSKLWVKPFKSIWESVDPDLHEVITVVPWEKQDIVIDEFEKGYKLWDKVLRHAKVIVWWWK